jgi:hypothetical protein
MAASCTRFSWYRILACAMPATLACDHASGNRVRSGWGNPKNAQKIAEQLNQAAAAWRAKYGPVPRSKSKTKKKRK